MSLSRPPTACAGATAAPAVSPRPLPTGLSATAAATLLQRTVPTAAAVLQTRQTQQQQLAPVDLASQVLLRGSHQPAPTGRLQHQRWRLLLQQEERHQQQEEEQVVLLVQRRQQPVASQLPCRSQRWRMRCAGCVAAVAGGSSVPQRAHEVHAAPLDLRCTQQIAVTLDVHTDHA